VAQTILITAGSLLLGVLAWQTLLTPRLRRAFLIKPSGDAGVTLAWFLIRLYARVVHRVNVTGAHVLQRADLRGGGPFVVVSNHSSPLDPFLIQAACPFLIRWMMARDQMAPGSESLWRFARVIVTDRNRSDIRAAREALGTLRRGDVLGIFPEGRLAQPHGTMGTFHKGIGVIVARSRVPVLLVCVTGTPDAPTIASAFVRPSRTRVQFIDVIRFEPDVTAAAITEQLRHRLQQASGLGESVDRPPVAEAPDPFLQERA
jgi:1-acyl-sn-glycerol-3-phosphate acyltransferase